MKNLPGYVILSAAKNLGDQPIEKAHERETVWKGRCFGLESHFSSFTLNALERISHSLRFFASLRMTSERIFFIARRYTRVLLQPGKYISSPLYIIRQNYTDLRKKRQESKKNSKGEKGQGGGKLTPLLTYAISPVVRS
jgi:hypothetical protein